MLKKNIIALIVYLFGVIVSLLFFNGNHWYLVLWVPLGLSIALVGFNGYKILPGLLVALLLFRLTAISFPNLVDLGYYSSFSYAFCEAMVYVFFALISKYRRWQNDSFKSDRELTIFFGFLALLLLLLSVVTSLLINGFPLEKVDLFQFVFPFFLVQLIAAAVFSSLVESFYREDRFIPNSSMGSYLRLSIYFASIALMIFLYSSSIFSKLEAYIVVFPLLLFLSVKYSSKIFSIIFSVFLIVEVVLANRTFKNSGFDGAIGFNDLELYLFVIVAFTTTSYLRVHTASRRELVQLLKSQFRKVEDDIAKRVKNYKETTKNLFEEIEKRVKIEQQLEDKKMLLSEAQKAGSIYAWEYSLVHQTFNWVEEGGCSVNLNSGKLTLSSLESIIHPDDLAKYASLKRKLFLKSETFDIELRALNREGFYGYYQLSGKTMFENDKPTRLVGVVTDITERKRVELELLEKEQKYLALFESNIDAVLVVDPETIEILDVNKSFVELYEYSVAEIVGQKFTVLSLEPDESTMAIRQAQKRGAYRVNSRLHKTKSGKVLNIEGSLIRHRVNEKDLLFVVIHDVTQRKKVELELVLRERKLRAYFESNLIGMGETSLTREWTSFNKKLLEILGLTEKEIKNLTWDQITHPDDLPGELNLYNKLLTHVADSYTVEKRFVNLQGDAIYCQVSVMVVRNGQSKVNYFIHLIEDITDKKRYEEELLQSQKHLQQAQEVSKIGTIWFYPGSDNVKLSDEALSILGFSKRNGNTSRKDLFKMAIPTETGHFIEYVCKAENGEEIPSSINQSVISQKGEVKHLLLNFGVTKKAHEVSEVLVTLIDITRIKEAENALIEANVLKDQLFAIIGHDLRSPIGSINQLVEHFASNRKDLDNDTQQGIVDILKKTSNETYLLLEDLLGWAKSQKTYSFKPVHTNFTAIANEVVGFSKTIAESKAITISLNLPLKVPVIADTEMLKTVLRNLLSNSIKFTPNGGSIVISVNEFPNFIEVSIADTGTGIEPEVAAKLFDDTYSHTSLGTNSEKGFGLGLKMVKKFVEKNGGSIKVDSVLGQGSVFQFTIPRALE